MHLRGACQRWKNEEKDEGRGQGARDDGVRPLLFATMTGSASFLSSASLLVALQLLSRAFTFILNQALLRFVSPQAFGTASIQFELLLSTILFLSREGFRNALLRAWPREESSKKDGLITVSPQVANLAIMPTIIGVPLSVFLAYGYKATCSEATRHQPYFDQAVTVYAGAAVIELLSEPMHIRFVCSALPVDCFLNVRP